jgi:hypothetical protein
MKVKIIAESEEQVEFIKDAIPWITISYNIRDQSVFFIFEPSYLDYLSGMNDDKIAQAIVDMASMYSNCMAMHCAQRNKSLNAEQIFAKVMELAPNSFSKCVDPKLHIFDEDE